MWLEIEALTPVHVGTGELLSSLEYAVNGQEVRIADLGRLFRRDPVRAEAIGQHLAVASPAALRAMTLDALLTRKEMADEGLWRYRLTGSEPTLVALAAARGREHELRVASKTPDGQAYLPGTGIKGALRTALIFAWSAATPDWARRFLDPGLWPGPANGVTQQVLYGARQDPNHDLLRALAVGDTYGASPTEALQLVQERVLSAKIRADRTRGGGDDEYKAFLVFLECLKPGSRLSCRVRILADLLDERKTGVLGWSGQQRRLSIQAVCDAANQMSREVCDWELEYFGLIQGRDCAGVIQFYRDLKGKLESPEKQSAYLCLGRGAGWHKLTPGILVARHLSQPEFADFREKYGLAAFGRFDRRAFVFPKSRKVVAEDHRAVLPLGWVRLVFSEVEPARVPRSAAPQIALPTPQVPAGPTPPGPVPPLGPQRDPRADAAERRIRGLREKDLNSLPDVVAEVNRCQEAERPPLFHLLRTRVLELVPRRKEAEKLLSRHPELHGDAQGK